MKSKELSLEEITERCVFIERNPDSAPVRTPIVLRLMQSATQSINKINKEKHDKFFHKICQIEFLPVMKKPTNFPLKWKGDEWQKRDSFVQ